MIARTWLIRFHWTTALLVTLSFAIAWMREPVEDLEMRLMWLNVHRTIGLVILVLTLIRLGMRLVAGPVSSRANLPLPFWIASRLVHFLIYALLIALPLVGWAQSSARERNLAIFGVPIPRLVAHDRDFSDVLGWWHEQLGWALLALILIHSLAALYHHYVRKDGVLRQMVGSRPSCDPQPEQRYDIAA